MNFDADTLYRLLPAIHRIRDAELARAGGTARGPLEELVAVFAEQIGVVEENLEQLYDDLFIETSADWVIPYIGDLIGYEALHGVVPRVASPRAEIAHTIALRRRKGTALVLEQLARDVTGWNARVVEFFEVLAATQYMNHVRPHSKRCVDLRDGDGLEWIGTAFESASRSVDVRRIQSARGRHNIPNVGLFLWRLGAYAHRETVAVRDGARRYRASPLGHDLPLYGRPEAEDEITHIAEPFNVPIPLSRRRLRRHLSRYYGERANAAAEIDNAAPSLVLTVDGTVIERDQINVCNLSDDGPDWAHEPPAGRYAVDPVLGRIALPPDASDPAELRVTWHEGFSADMGGGEYDRSRTLPEPAAGVTVVRVPNDHATISDALAALGGDGIVEITDSSRYEESPSVVVAEDGSVEIRAEEGRRPTLALSSPLRVRGEEGSHFGINGLQVSGGGLRVIGLPGNRLARVDLAHTTFVPGHAISASGEPAFPASPSLEIAIADVDVTLDRAIVGGIACHERARVSAVDSIIDATSHQGVAFAAQDAVSPGGTLALESTTVIGKVHAREFGTVSNSILLASLAPADTWPAAVRAERKQVGCIRFSFLPFDSIVPRRYRCQPDSAESARRIGPRFTSLRYGTAAYCQLAVTTPDQVRRGAEDESEMGAFHHLFGALRETNLRIRLREYVRVGLDAGIFYES